MARKVFGQVFFREDRGRWFLKFPDPLRPKVLGKRAAYVVRSVSANKKDAEDLLKDIRKAILSGTYTPRVKEPDPEAPPSLTVAEAVREYVKAKEAEGAAESTLDCYGTAAKHLRASPLGSRAVHETTASHVEAFLAWRRERYFDGKGAATVEGKRPSNATVALDLAILSASFGRLVRLGVLDANPCARVRRPKGRESVRVALNEGETEALLRACSPQVRPLVLGALTTGARFSELAGLRWTDVDLVSGCVRVFRKKNGSADTLPLHPALAESLKALREARAAAGNRTIPSMEPLFLNSKGGPMKDPGPDWHRALEDAGLAHRPGVDFHCLRTTFASSFLGVGGAVSDLRSVLGHRSLAVTERYVRALDSRTRASVYRLRFGGAEGGVVRAIQDAVRTQCVPATGTDGPVGGMALSMGGSQVPVPSGDTAAFPPLREAG